jgi:hypothetical protein
MVSCTETLAIQKEWATIQSSGFSYTKVNGSADVSEEGMATKRLKKEVRVI